MTVISFDTEQQAIAAYNLVIEMAKRELGEWLYETFVKDLELSGNDVIYSPSSVIDIEDGTPKYDMKEGLLSSSKAHVGENGRYLAVPFSYSKGGSEGSKLPASVYKALLKMPTNTPTKKSDLPKKWQESATNVEGYTHKSSIYVGIKKTDKRSANSSKARYSFDSFRVVSDNSPENSWWHPGFEAYKFLERAKEIIG
jgi:hypothetical protein